MTVLVDRNNPQVVVISARDANGNLQKVGTLTVDYVVSGGKESAKLYLVPEAGVTMTGFTSPATLALP